MTQPASTCTRCRHPGVIAEIQRDINNNPISANNLRFVCPNCLGEWNTSLAEAELHGRFLDLAKLR